MNLANALRGVCRYREALPVDDRALELNPDDAEMHYNRALTRLVAGDFGARFTAVARSIARANDRRGVLKHYIKKLTELTHV